MAGTKSLVGLLRDALDGNAEIVGRVATHEQEPSYIQYFQQLPDGHGLEIKLEYKDNERTTPRDLQVIWIDKDTSYKVNSMTAGFHDLVFYHEQFPNPITHQWESRVYKLEGDTDMTWFDDHLPDAKKNPLPLTQEHLEAVENAYHTFIHQAYEIITGTREKFELTPIDTSQFQAPIGPNPGAS